MEMETGVGFWNGSGRFSVRNAMRRLCSTIVGQQRKKIMFFGTDDFSVPTLQLLHQSMLEKDAVEELEVCTSTANHAVRSVKEFCTKNRLKMHDWPLTDLRRNQFDLGIVASFGKLLTSKVISAFPLGVLNVHASILPRWRGASPICHAILNGDGETGISIMEVMPHHFDIGKVLAQERTEIHPDQTSSQLSKVLAGVGSKLMLDVVRKLDCYKASGVVQNEQCVTYAPKIQKSMFRINWNKSSANQVYDQWRALSEISRLHSVWQDTGERVGLDKATNPSVTSDLNIEKMGGVNCNAEEAAKQEFLPGRVIYVKRGKRRCLCVKCAKGWITFSQFHYGCQKVMAPTDFFNGYISRHRTRPQFFSDT